MNPDPGELKRKIFKYSIYPFIFYRCSMYCRLAATLVRIVVWYANSGATADKISRLSRQSLAGTLRDQLLENK
jgi:hypothetical protein